MRGFSDLRLIFECILLPHPIFAFASTESKVFLDQILIPSGTPKPACDNANQATCFHSNSYAAFLAHSKFSPFHRILIRLQDFPDYFTGFASFSEDFDTSVYIGKIQGSYCQRSCKIPKLKSHRISPSRNIIEINYPGKVVRCLKHSPDQSILGLICGSI